MKKGISLIVKTSLGDVYELPSYMRVKDDKIYNLNTKRYEAVKGDIVDLPICDIFGEEISCYTDGQIVPLDGHCCIVPGNEQDDIFYTHIVSVKVIGKKETSSFGTTGNTLPDRFRK